MTNKYLITTTTTYRVPTVTDALRLRDELSHLSYGELVSFSYTTKQIKKGGEVIEEYQSVKAKITFQSEKDPEDSSFDLYFKTREENDNAF